MSPARIALGALAVPLMALALAAPASAGAGSGSLPPKDVAFINRAVAAQMAEQRLPGLTVSIRAPGKGTFLRSYGRSNMSTGRRLRPGDHYRIASVTKTFVATAILQLADRGRLRLDDRLSKYVAGVPNGDTITIRQLLGMRAGVLTGSTTRSSSPPTTPTRCCRDGGRRTSSVCCSATPTRRSRRARRRRSTRTPTTYCSG